jgi:hypothetical protein
MTDRCDNEESTDFAPEIPQEVVDAMPYGPGMLVKAVFQKIWDYLNRDLELQKDFGIALDLMQQYRGTNPPLSMFDVTRHRVLKALGESDLGKSWNWIEGEVKRIKDQLEA